MTSSGYPVVATTYPGKVFKLGLRKWQQLECQPTNQETMGQNPVRCWAFLVLLSLILIEGPYSDSQVKAVNIYTYVEKAKNCISRRGAYGEAG